MFNYDRHRRISAVCLIFVFCFLCGCKPSKETPTAARPVVVKPVVTPRSLAVTDAADLACQMIQIGDFEDAAEAIAKSVDPDDAAIGQIRQIIEEYRVIDANRIESRDNAYSKQIDELAGLSLPEDANGISKALSVVATALEYANDQQKESLLAKKFVKKVVGLSLEKAADFESEGKWIDAYSHCYYWLTLLYKDNAEYKLRAESLTAKAMIEMSLKDNSCETSAERHEGIKASMLFRAVGKLDYSYVEIVDYDEMTRKALERCRLLGEVVVTPGKDLTYQCTPKQYEQWSKGIDAIEYDLGDSVVAVTRDEFLLVFDSVLALNSISLKLPREVAIAQFSEAALRGLDPFTVLVWPWQIKSFQKSMTQHFTGIGVEISKASGDLKVVSLLLDTPAYLSGLIDVEDTIVAVEGELTKDMTINCAVSKITGPKGTKVTLTMRHEGADETFDITVTRDRIIVPTVRGWQRTETGKWLYMVDPANGIGYAHITGFTETTVPGMSKVLNQLERQGLKGLIIDLRFNSGGYLSAAAAIVDMFVEKGTIVTSQPKWGVPNYERAHKKGTHPDYPIVILVNESSASASEIVAGALQDEIYKRAILVGSRTYGKGSVQTITESTGNHSTMKYTMAYYHLPSNQRVKNRYALEKEGRKDWGVAPDVEIKLHVNEWRRMLETQRKNDVLAKAGHDQTSDPLKRHTLKDTLETDPQLALGILVVKSQMIQAGENIISENDEDTGVTN
ncbi:MAG TPA: S41 family peptidase [Phycisphaerales bacterium]|nr:S41 family peptidase [Phycisphaerales bacterium]